uniref:Uncharacterized protein n=1 Tax=Arion vulgaris TaxID=1028688 RepID=A0A0B7BBT1_9EUPU
MVIPGSENVTCIHHTVNDYAQISFMEWGLSNVHHHQLNLLRQLISLMTLLIKGN